MATSTFPGRSDYQIDYTVSTVKQEVANNRSLVRRRLLMKNIGSGSGAWNNNTNNTWSISGPNNQSGSFSFDFRNYSSLTLVDRQDWVTHNSDGTKSFSSSASVSADLPVGMRTANVSMSVTLKTIPRATTPTVPSSFTTGSAGTIQLPRASSSFTHTVTYKVGSQTGTISNSAGTSVSWTPPHSLVSAFPNSTSGSGTITVVTKSGSTTIGSKSASFTLKAATSIVPTMGDVTWTENNPKIASIVEQHVQHLSILTPSFDASGIHGSTIPSSGKTIQIDNVVHTVNSNTKITPKYSGNPSYVQKVVDSRGRSTQETLYLPVLPYTNPYIGSSGWSIYRADPGSYLPNPDGIGESIVCQIHAVATKILKAGNNVNFVKISFRYKTFDTPWSGWSWYNSTSYEFNGQLRILAPTGGFLNTKSYEIEIVVEDTVGGAPLRFITTVPTTSVAMDIHGDSVGIGKIWERGSLDVAGDIYARNFNMFDLVPIGSIQCFAGPDDKIPPGWRKCNGMWLVKASYPELYSIIGDIYTDNPTSNPSSFQVPNLVGRVPVGYGGNYTDLNALGKQAGTYTHTLTTSEMPSHTHTGITGEGSSMFYRTVGGAGTSVSANHVTGYSGGTYTDRNNDTWPLQNHTHSFTTKSTGSGNAHNNVQPSIALNWMIKVNREV